VAIARGCRQSPVTGGLVAPAEVRPRRSARAVVQRIPGGNGLTARRPGPPPARQRTAAGPVRAPSWGKMTRPGSARELDGLDPFSSRTVNFDMDPREAVSLADVGCVKHQAGDAVDATGGRTAGAWV
jgi:hypothetical protein